MQLTQLWLCELVNILVQSWLYAKKSLICGFGVVLGVTFVQAVTVLNFRKDIPLLWGTHNAEIVYFASILLCVEVVKLVFAGIYNAMYGLFIGLGLPHYGAWLNILIMCCLNLCILYIVLEVMGLRNNTLYGLLIVWLSPVICRMIAAVGLMIIFWCKVDINKVMDKSLMRIEDTIKDYGSFMIGRRERYQ